MVRFPPGRHCGKGHRFGLSVPSLWRTTDQDLRGLGDSSKPLTGYDGKTLAEEIHQLVTQLGFKTIFLVGHDVRSQPA